MEWLSSALELATDFPKTSAVLTVGLTLLMLRATRRKNGNVKKIRTRSTSIGATGLMLAGALPDPKYFCVINLRVNYFTESGLPSVESLKKTFSEHIVPFQRFHSVPVQIVPAKKYMWTPVKMDLDAHFIQEAPCDDINARVDKLLAEPLKAKDAGRPWWEVHIIPSSKPTVPGGTLVIRVHHVIGDGISLTEAFADALTDKDGDQLRMGNVFSPKRGGPKNRGIGPKIRMLLRTPWFVFDIFRSVGKVLAAAAVGCDSTCQLTKRSETTLNDHFTVYFPTHSLQLLKDIKSKLTIARGESGCNDPITINDVSFALFAGSLRRFSKAMGEDPNKISLRSLTPFAAPEAACQETRYATMLRNNWTFLINELPISQPDAKSRVMASHNTWSQIKKSTIVPVSFFLTKFASNFLPYANLVETNVQLMKRIAIVFSNVPGPQQPPYLAGKQVTSANMLFPNGPQQVGMLSIDGKVSTALVMRMNDKQEFAQVMLPKCFIEELVELAGSVGIPEDEVMRNVEAHLN